MGAQSTEAKLAGISKALRDIDQTLKAILEKLELGQPQPPKAK